MYKCEGIECPAALALWLKKMRYLLFFHDFFITLQEIAEFMTDSK